MNDTADSRELSSICDEEQRLLALIEDLELFSSQYKTVSQFNLFEVIGLQRQEIKHSNFLAFLLAPAKGHGLRDAFLKRLISKVFENLPAPAPIRPLKFALANFDDAVISREWRNIDLLVESESNGFVLAIENKIDAAEGKNQLAGYEQVVKAAFPDKKTVLFAYLTPDGDPASSNTWATISYSDVIDALLDTKLTGLTAEARLTIEHYVDMIRRNLVPDQELIEQCRRLYSKHREALNLINRYGQVNAFETAANSFFENRPELRSSVVTAARAAFLPASLIEIVPEFQGLNWFAQSRPIIFFFHLSADGKLGLIMEVGPLVSEEFPREALARRLLDHFHSSAKVYPKYTRFYTRFVKLSQEQADDADAIRSAMSKFYDDAAKDHISAICRIASDFFKRQTPISGVASSITS